MDVERDLGRDDGPQPVGIDAPVGEQQVAPGLAHQRASVGQRPREVGGLAQGGALRGHVCDPTG